MANFSGMGASYINPKKKERKKERKKSSFVCTNGGSFLH
jgi:hypothetical protein